jgi:hypothetical protein
VKMEVDEDASADENVEYVSEQLDVQGSTLEAFSDVFARFQTTAAIAAVRAFSSLAHSHSC